MFEKSTVKRKSKTKPPASPPRERSRTFSWTPLLRVLETASRIIGGIALIRRSTNSSVGTTSTEVRRAASAPSSPKAEK